MAVMELFYCDLYVGRHGLHIERIQYDSEFANNMIPKLDAFFIKVILPKVFYGTRMEDKALSTSGTDSSLSAGEQNQAK